MRAERRYRVLVDDNFHHGDESERYELGEFGTLEAALEASRRIVDEYLASAYEPGMTPDALMASYVMFGEDPFVVAVPPGDPGVLFSARDYARGRCAELCDPGAGGRRSG